MTEPGDGSLFAQWGYYVVAATVLFTMVTVFPAAIITAMGYPILFALPSIVFGSWLTALHVRAAWRLTRLPDWKRTRA
jgi:hypothetical protein